ncbi:hypothetical protein ECANGB1_1667 [Enterospora canceri]|uniref:Uncharacterized protein n=1 Tax=Enterospora canceri TaxID=1081671 RepID=A0A1Y1S983_9MICR|nr:hypothetical protein ECANGB1_1667 [Enterospora canceri]
MAGDSSNEGISDFSGESSSDPFEFNEDYEILLSQKQQIFEMRNELLDLKTRGFDSLNDQNKKLIKVFLGYVYKLGMLDDEMINAMTDRIIEGNYEGVMIEVLSKRVLNKGEIMDYLKK